MIFLNPFHEGMNRKMDIAYVVVLLWRKFTIQYPIVYETQPDNSGNFQTCLSFMNNCE